MQPSPAALMLCQAARCHPNRGGSHGLAHSHGDYRHRYRNHGRAHDMVRRAIQEVDPVLDLSTLVAMPSVGDRGSLGASPLAVWAIKHLMAPVHRRVYRRTGGRLFPLGSVNRNILLLTPTGRKTGRSRTTPEFFLRDSARLVVCSVTPGSERTNPWVLNRVCCTIR